jgi:hypothetical protein
MLYWVINMVAFVMVVYLLLALWSSDKALKVAYEANWKMSKHSWNCKELQWRAEEEAWQARRDLAVERNEHAETRTQVRLLRDRLEQLDPDVTRPLHEERAEVLRRLAEYEAHEAARKGAA